MICNHKHVGLATAMQVPVLVLEILSEKRLEADAAFSVGFSAESSNALNKPSPIIRG